MAAAAAAFDTPTKPRKVHLHESWSMEKRTAWQAMCMDQRFQRVLKYFVEQLGEKDKKMKWTIIAGKFRTHTNLVLCAELIKRLAAPNARGSWYAKADVSPPWQPQVDYLALDHDYNRKPLHGSYETRTHTPSPQAVRGVTPSPQMPVRTGSGSSGGGSAAATGYALSDDDQAAPHSDGTDTETAAAIVRGLESLQFAIVEKLGTIAQTLLTIADVNNKRSLMKEHAKALDEKVEARGRRPVPSPPAGENALTDDFANPNRSRQANEAAYLMEGKKDEKGFKHAARTAFAEEPVAAAVEAAAPPRAASGKGKGKRGTKRNATAAALQDDDTASTPSRAAAASAAAAAAAPSAK